MPWLNARTNDRQAKRTTGSPSNDPNPTLREKSDSDTQSENARKRENEKARKRENEKTRRKKRLQARGTAQTMDAVVEQQGSIPLEATTIPVSSKVAAAAAAKAARTAAEVAAEDTPVVENVQVPNEEERVDVTGASGVVGHGVDGTTGDCNTKEMAASSSSLPIPSVSTPSASLYTIYSQSHSSHNSQGLSSPRVMSVVQGLSLLANVALMLYAHLGLSAVILSNRSRVIVAEAPQQPSSSSGGVESSNNDTAFAAEGACVASDLERWTTGMGARNKTMESNYCATVNGCLITVDCNTNCMSTVFQYTLPCAACFGQIPLCSLNDGCAFVCQQDNGNSIECKECTVNCNAEFEACSGLDLSVATLETNRTNSNTTDDTGTNSTNENNSGSDQTEESNASNAAICQRQQDGVPDNDTVDEWYIAYELYFFQAIATAWNNQAAWLAILIAVFSGLWPYVKNFGLLALWFMPLPYDKRSDILHALRRLGKYTFVDIYVVILILVGVALPINVASGSVPVIIRGEPRGAILAFLIATVWNFGHLECLTHWHNCNHPKTQQLGNRTSRDANKNISHTDNDGVGNKDIEKNNMRDNRDVIASNHPIRNDSGSMMDLESIAGQPEETTARVGNPLPAARTIVEATRFVSRHSEKGTVTRSDLKFAYPRLAHLALSAVLGMACAFFIAGSTMEIIRFTSILGGESVGCERSYNLYTLGSTLVSEFALSANSARWGTWILNFSYMMFLVAIPLFVLATHVTTFIGNVSLPKWIYRTADVGWTFVSVEVLLLAVFSLQRKFDELIAALAGNDGSQFFGISSQLGPGFYLLLMFCITGGFSQFFLNCAISQRYQIDLNNKVDSVWAKLLRSLLVDADAENVMKPNRRQG